MIKEPVDLTSGQLRSQWTPALRTTCNDFVPQVIRRSRHRVAVLVPIGWHRIVRGDERVRVVGSTEAKLELTSLLDEVDLGGFYIVTADGYEVAALVPVNWFEEKVRMYGLAETFRVKELEGRRHAT